MDARYTPFALMPYQIHHPPPIIQNCLKFKENFSSKSGGWGAWVAYVDFNIFCFAKGKTGVQYAEQDTFDKFDTKIKAFKVTKVII